MNHREIYLNLILQRAGMIDQGKVTVVQNKALVELSKIDNYYHNVVVKFISDRENCKLLRDKVSEDIEKNLDYEAIKQGIEDMIFGK